MSVAAVLLVTCCMFGVAQSFRSQLKTIAGSGQAVPEQQGYSYETHYYTQQVDHFGFTNTDTYQQRYLVNSRHWKAGGPIFFYTGNEGDITWFCNNTGFMWDIAPQFGAMLVFAEHRYYGKSLPYGNYSYKSNKYTDYLTSEQALADFVTLINHMKSTVRGMANSKVVAFGGSYGGMLAAWIRFKYPNIVVGALAASAPIWQFAGMNPCGAFNAKTTQTFYNTSRGCTDNIRRSWVTINDVASRAGGLQFISESFKLCKPLKTDNDVFTFKGWLNGALTNLAMVDYPYPASFLEPLPAWPIKAVCEPLTNPVQGRTLITQLAEGMNVYFNYTGNTKCLDISQDSTMALSEMGWDYQVNNLLHIAGPVAATYRRVIMCQEHGFITAGQACTEMMSPMCADNVHDMFEKYKWNTDAYILGCKRTWGVVPRAHWTQDQYGGFNIQFASNIVFSNGLLDPWSALGVNKTLSKTLIYIPIAEGAHHLDLRASNKLDPISVIAAREREKQEILRWINE